MKLSRIDF